ncbi:glycosyltransferase family A protein [Paenibacillus tepidiphilus]|uniref:glycosyltransferase family A protein n=1 Tax=Paenibacillus tepidiphilus TaxID=2608683 RepID=UPI00123BA4AB|nr:glycosyltransferase family A protein [Paenibacillus tepidiphilus]
MVIQLIWIAVVYAFAAMLVHILHNRERTRQKLRIGKVLHYIMITRNHEAVVEWYIRMLPVQAFLTGKPLYVTLIDDGSDDRTVTVAARLALDGASVDIAPLALMQDIGEQRAVWGEHVLDLRTAGGPAVMPLMRMPESGRFGSKREH